MTSKLSKELSKHIHQIGREREDQIITGKTKLTVTQIFLMDENWMKILVAHIDKRLKELEQKTGPA